MFLMKTKILLLFVLILFLFIMPVCAETYALIMGAGDYKYDNIPKLPGAIEDARRIKQALIETGMVKEEHITYIEDPVFTEIKFQLEDLFEKGEAQDRLIFYFAGHSEVGINEEGQQDTFLCGIYVRKDRLEESAYNFREHFEEIGKKLKAQQTVMIFDTCYAGGIRQARKLDIKSIEKVGFEAMAQAKGVNFLFSSGEEEISQEMGEDQGGWYTHYLLEGLEGAANLDGDDYINLEELSTYVQQKVSKSTSGAQNPMSIIIKDIPLIEDESKSYLQAYQKISKLYFEEKIDRQRFDTFGKILMQEPEKDNEEERAIRQILKNYNALPTLGIDYILTMTDKYFETSPITKQIRIETTPSNATIYINGQYQGTSPLTKELPEGTHTIEARKDGYKTKTTAKTIGTQTKDMSRIETITLTLEKETGSLYIQSTPSGANIYLNGSYKGTTNKTTENLEPGTYSLKLTKDGYKDKTQSLTIEAGKRESAYITLESAEYQPSAQALEQVLVKGGTFQMGNTRGDSEGDSDEKPVHTVKLTYDYYIGKYEVTFNEYDAYCEDTGKSKEDDEGWGRGNRPVIWVSWNDAISYCNWLSESEGLSKAYDINGNLLDKNGRQTRDITQVEGYRLPTEAEWENAARGGHKNTSDYKYAGSNTIDEVAWYRDNSNYKTHEVGQKAPNELGIYDMSGNVWEWCHDWYGSYTSTTQTNPTGPNSASDRVYRGGSWGDYARRCRVADRICFDPDYSDIVLGLRIARTQD